ncbi:hypothetical protein [Streptomyces afghaniensis]|uniref:hypothetical protein n=1 Tax=Streptomyces afghaniensis TaxID=66865 RepID=UPI000FE1AB85|nr:hypothetical protein [Streptomyces afghaniensis]
MLSSPGAGVANQPVAVREPGASGRVAGSAWSEPGAAACAGPCAVSYTRSDWSKPVAAGRAELVSASAETGVAGPVRARGGGLGVRTGRRVSSEGTGLVTPPVGSAVGLVRTGGGLRARLLHLVRAGGDGRLGGRLGGPVRLVGYGRFVRSG